MGEITRSKRQYDGTVPVMVMVLVDEVTVVGALTSTFKLDEVTLKGMKAANLLTIGISEGDVSP